MSRLRPSDAADVVAFWCPGCDRPHSIKVVGEYAWVWDQSAEKPTFSPSIKVTYNGSDAGQVREDRYRAPAACCHSFVRGGKIEFLADSTHALAGQTVDLPDWPE